MIGFTARRLAAAVVTAWVASVIAFVLFWTVPNVDPSYFLGGAEHGNDFTRQQAEEKWGLDDPLPAQYVHLMRSILNGDVDCFYGCGSLRTAFVEALPVTASLVLGAAMLSIGLGVWLALVCVRHRGRWPDRAITAAATAAYSVPSIVLAALLWTFVAHRWGWFPDGGYVKLTDNPFKWASHLILPWIAAGLPFAGAYVQIVRASLLGSVDEDWVRTARAKGLPEKRVVRRHVLRNGLIPPVNVWGLDFSHAFGGFALYVEVIFGLPGVGALTADTIGTFDLPPIVALAVYLAIVVVVTSAIVDVASRGSIPGSAGRGHRPEPTPATVTLDPLSPMNRDLDDRDGPRDECGVFGVYAPERDVARLAYFALYALQHRGQESAGIAATQSGQIMTVRDLGLVSQVFDEEKLRALQGQMAIGHVRYSTTGSSAWENAQPVWRSDRRQVALAHNGNLINAVELHAELRERGVQFRGTSDSEIIAALLSTHEADRIEDAVADVMPRLEGAFSTVVMTKDSVVAFRDPVGLRPLALGMVGEDYCVASESCAFDIIARGAAARGAAGRDGLARRGRDRDSPAGGVAAARLLRLRAHLLRAPGLDPRGQPHAGVAPQDGRDPVARGAGRGGRGDRRAGLGEPGGVRATRRRPGSRATTA